MTGNRHEQIAEFVMLRLHEIAAKHGIPAHQAQYRYEHTLRVTTYGQQIAAVERADPEIVFIGCLLHDVAVLDPGDVPEQARIAVSVARPLLTDLGYDPKVIASICYILATYPEPEPVDTIEARCVGDADNLDRFGALRAVHWVNRNINNYPAMINDLNERLERLRYLRTHRIMGTETGHARFNQQLDRQIALFEAIVAESKLTYLPSLVE